MKDKNIDSLGKDETKKSIFEMTTEEKEHHVIYGKDGLPKYYDRKLEYWVPVRAFVTREDILNVKKNYPVPRLYPFRIISRFLFPLIVGALSALIVYLILKQVDVFLDIGYYFLIGGSVTFVDFLIHLSDVIIIFVQLYQKNAPDEVRERCHLTPSCSFYCIYAVMKYGAIIGLIKTIGRLHRCLGQEGVDEP